MRNLPKTEAAAIYRRFTGFARLRRRRRAHAAVAGELFDTGVNMGPAVAATFSSAH